MEVISLRRIEGSRMIPHPVEAVFEAVSDPQRQLEWDAGTLRHVQKLTDGPPGKGSRYRGKFKWMGTIEFEFPEFDPPRSFSVLAWLPAGPMSHLFTLDDAPGGTTLTQVMELTPNTFGRLVWPVMRQMMERRIDLIGRELDEHLRSRSG